VSTAPRYTEVERAIRSVPGVAEASVVQAADSGRGRLRIRLHAGEDPERVSWSVAATLRERFGIALDPDEIRPSVAPAEGNGQGAGNGRTDLPAPSADDVLQSPEPEPTGDDLLVEELDEPIPPPPVDVPAAGEARVVLHGRRGSARAVIRDLRSHSGPDGVRVTATLDYSGRLVEGRAMGVATSRGLMRTIAEATVMAVAELTGQRLRAQVDRVSLAGCDPTTVTVVIIQASAEGEELLLGASIVRHDVEHAVMRATLDALNRRVEPDLRA
jgi:hypothetical protein